MSANDEAIRRIHEILKGLRAENASGLAKPKPPVPDVGGAVEGSSEEESNEPDMEALLEGDNGDTGPSDEEMPRKKKPPFGR